MGKQRLLLHVCCAPCSPHVVSQLSESYEVTLFFYNPNIHPLTEYEARLTELREWTNKTGIDLMVENYDIKTWFSVIDGYEGEPEKGVRCEVCFDLRLGKTAYVAAAKQFDSFGTVMSVSPHKNAVVINQIGARHAKLSEVEYLEANWKKKDGFKISSLLSSDLGFYRQEYCGCVYSLEAFNKRKLEHPEWRKLKSS